MPKIREPMAFAMRLKSLLIEPFDRAAWEEISDERLHLRIGNDRALTSRTAGLDALAAFRERILGFGCHYCELWQRREAVYAETDVHFFGRSGKVEQIPCAIVARVVRDTLQDLRFHLDPGPIP